MKSKWDENLEIFDKIVAKCSRFDRKGKSMIYTSANGYMFAILNKAGEIGLRFSKEIQKKYMEEWNSTHLMSHGAVMQGYVLVPDDLLKDLDAVAKYMDESYDYVMTLEPK